MILFERNQRLDIRRQLRRGGGELGEEILSQFAQAQCIRRTLTLIG